MTVAAFHGHGESHDSKRRQPKFDAGDGTKWHVVLDGMPFSHRLALAMLATLFAPVIIIAYLTAGAVGLLRR